MKMCSVANTLYSSFKGRPILGLAALLNSYYEVLRRATKEIFYMTLYLQGLQPRADHENPGIQAGGRDGAAPAVGGAVSPPCEAGQLGLLRAPMSSRFQPVPVTHAVLASDIGDPKLGYEMFRKACLIDLNGANPHSSDADIHAASYALDLFLAIVLLP